MIARHLIRVTALLMLFSSLQMPLSAQGDNLGVAIIIGQNHAWMIESPEGWNLDQRGALVSGLGAAFVPEGRAWSSSSIVMYANGIPKTFDTVTVASIVYHDSLKAVKKGATVRRSNPISTIQGVDAEVCHITANDSSSCEAVAYIDGPTVIATIVLSSRNSEDFLASLPAFTRLVDSYEWITSDQDRIADLKRMR